MDGTDEYRSDIDSLKLKLNLSAIRLLMAP